MKKEVLDALKASISKWKKIVAGKLGDMGMRNCALCTLFNSPFHFAAADDCIGCPVHTDTYELYCGCTPYAVWLDHHDISHPDTCNAAEGLTVRCDTCLKLAKAELKFLKSLLPKKGKR